MYTPEEMEALFDLINNASGSKLRIHELHIGPPASGISWIVEPRSKL